MSSSFRASPWVPYQPTVEVTQPVPQQHQNPAGTTMIMDMAMDIDMDAPQISTLRDDDTPPPPTKKSGAGRKPKAPKFKVSEPVAWRSTQEKRKVLASEEDLAEEQEEDQLIDDDDGSASAAVTGSRSTETTPKKKPGPKPGSKKNAAAKAAAEAASADGAPPPKKAKKTKVDKSGSAGQPSTADTAAAPHITVEGGSAPSEPIILKLSTGKKKQASPRKSATAAPRGRGGKAAAVKQRGAIPPAVALEDAAMSEAGFTGTAASSPATAALDLPEIEINEPGTPETEIPIAPSSPATVATQLPEEVINLENVAVPQYPLPTRPFPVQAPVKITSGFAPPMALDKSGKKVRHWRVQHREIRGIAGGRWFTKTWVGEKESEYATSIADGTAKLEEKVFLGHGASGLGPRLLAQSAPAGRGRGRGGSKSASVVASAVPSRAGSVIPDFPGQQSISMRAPTKMRILQLPPSENGDSDMAAPEPEPAGSEA